MNRFILNMIVVALGCVFSAGAMAADMTREAYSSGKSRIAADYKAARAACASMTGNANDICIAEAKGKEKVAKAELEDSYKPTSRNHYQVSVAKAEAAYAVAKERCDDMAGNAKDVCVKQAKAAQTAAKADAKAQMKTYDADVKAKEKSTEARKDASETATDARQDAAEDKRDAEYKVAKEKCDAMSGSAKDQCLSQAKTRYGK